MPQLSTKTPNYADGSVKENNIFSQLAPLFAISPKLGLSGGCLNYLCRT